MPKSQNKRPEIPVNFLVNRETEPQNCQTETAEAIPRSRPRGDGLRRQTRALKTRKPDMQCLGSMVYSKNHVTDDSVL
jgi:hypothetical protein